VYADESATCGAGVLCSLAFEKRVHSFFLDLIQVVQHTHCVLCPVPGVQMFEFFAWHIRTVIAEMSWAGSDGFTIFDETVLTGFGILRCFISASQTLVLRSLEGLA